MRLPLNLSSASNGLSSGVAYVAHFVLTVFGSEHCHQLSKHGLSRSYLTAASKTGAVTVSLNVGYSVCLKTEAS